MDAFTYEAKCLSVLDSGELNKFMKRKRSVDTFISEIELYSGSRNVSVGAECIQYSDFIPNFISYVEQNFILNIKDCASMTILMYGFFENLT